MYNVLTFMFYNAVLAMGPNHLVMNLWTVQLILE